MVGLSSIGSHLLLKLLFDWNVNYAQRASKKPADVLHHCIGRVAHPGLRTQRIRFRNDAFAIGRQKTFAIRSNSDRGWIPPYGNKSEGAGFSRDSNVKNRKHVI